MANDINSLIIIGRLTRDLGSDERSFGYVQSGQAKANISIAVNRGRKQGDQWVEEVYYFDVTIWGKTAENLKPYLLKGTQIAVKGFLKQDRWNDKDGKVCTKVSIVAEQVELLGGKKDNNSASSPDTVYPTAQATQSAYAQEYENQQQEEGAFQEDLPYGSEEDIPF